MVEEHAGNAGRSGVRGANGVLLYPYHPPGVININTKEADLLSQPHLLLMAFSVRILP